MLAIPIQRHGAADTLVPADLPRPQPGARDVLVRVHAVGVNRLDLLLREGRVFQVPPGKHELEVRYQYEIPGGGGGGLAMSDNTTQITCRVWLTYDNFAPGQRYRLEVRPQLRKALALLTDANGQLVAKTDFQGRMDCGLF